MKLRLIAQLIVAACVGISAAVASPRTIELLGEALALKPDLRNGALLYRAQCAGCHGPRAWGVAFDVVPALAGQQELYLLKQLVDLGELDRTVPEMHRQMARAELSTPQTWRDLAAYLSGLTPNQQAEHGDGTALEHGERIYKEVCAACHGETARGDDGGAVPSLRNQHYSYLLLQLRGVDAGHRYNVAEEMFESITTLSAVDMRSVADYLSRLQDLAVEEM